MFRYVLGDVTDASSVEEAMQGCDAVLHAGSIYTLDVRRAKEIQRTNETGTDLVIGTAQHLGLDPIIHVSSIAAFFSSTREMITVDSRIENPLSSLLTPSKASFPSS